MFTRRRRTCAGPGRPGGEGGRAVLVAALSERDAALRAKAAAALGGIGPDAQEAVPALASALADPSGNVAADAAHALGKIGRAAKGAVPVLIDVVKDAAVADPRDGRSRPGVDRPGRPSRRAGAPQRPCGQGPARPRGGGGGADPNR